jgi:GMP synthase (glutamine-hydrolysing)
VTENVVVIDYGSQYTQLIARRLRELHVYCEVVPHWTPVAELRARKPAALVLSGGPDSVLREGAPRLDPVVLELGIPVLAICYGFQILAQTLGGRVEASSHREFGRAELSVKGSADPLFAGVPERSVVWMSHGDRIAELPPGFEVLATSPQSPAAAVRASSRPLYGLLFHPEVVHTEHGARLLENFALRIAGLAGRWTMEEFIQTQTARIHERVGAQRVICGVSGGVDSTVLAVLLHRSIGSQVRCIFVDNGLLRSGEREEVEGIFRQLAIPIEVVSAGELFVSRLRGVEDPEKKRVTIGHSFIEVFERAAGSDARFLAQGTLYPDVIESVSVCGPSATIKTHHNVGGLPEVMRLEILEPLRDLFKDEVRELARKLGIPSEFSRRHPFPGPGLAIRIVGEVTEQRLAVLRRADRIVVDEVKQAGWYDRLWQAFAVYLPLRSVGVMGDARTYEHAVAVRCVTSLDAMTGDWADLPADLLGRISNRIINEVKGINRVVYDISSKPPATIEWE